MKKLSNIAVNWLTMNKSIIFCIPCSECRSAGSKPRQIHCVCSHIWQQLASQHKCCFCFGGSRRANWHRRYSESQSSAVLLRFFWGEKMSSKQHAKTVWHFSSNQTFQSIEKSFSNLRDKVWEKQKKKKGKAAAGRLFLDGALWWADWDTRWRYLSRKQSAVPERSLPWWCLWVKWWKKNKKKNRQNLQVSQNLNEILSLFYHLFITSCLLIPADSFFFSDHAAALTLYLVHGLVWFNANLPGIDLR